MGKCDRCGEEHVEYGMSDGKQVRAAILCQPDAAHEAAVACYDELSIPPCVCGCRDEVCENCNKNITLIARHMRAYGVELKAQNEVLRESLKHATSGQLYREVYDERATLTDAARAVVAQADKVDAGWLRVQSMKPSAILIEREYIDALAALVRKHTSSRAKPSGTTKGGGGA